MNRFRMLLAIGSLLVLLAGAAQADDPAAPAQEEPVPQFAIAGVYVQPSADLLRRFGIIAGDPDGNLHYDRPVTRAEMAKLAVAGIGLTDSARAAALLPPAFADVEGHWAAGFITVARARGIVGGYDDGTFRPDAPVTYAEAITILLRAAGVHPAGSWPDAYLSAAERYGVLDTRLASALKPEATAQRGGVFLLAERAFTQIRDEQGTTVLQRAFRVASPAVAATAVADGDEVLVTGTVTGAHVVHVDGRPVLVMDGAFQMRMPRAPGAQEVLVHAIGETGAQTVRQVPIRSGD